LKEDHPRIISAKFGWDWHSSFRGEEFFLISSPQKVHKFELYKHNDELFNIYYRIFLWTLNFAYFDRLCKLEKGGMKLKKKSVKIGKSSKFIKKNPVIHVKKLIIMLIQFKFGHFLA
jgi:hypothetical protein